MSGDQTHTRSQGQEDVVNMPEMQMVCKDPIPTLGRDGVEEPEAVGSRGQGSNLGPLQLREGGVYELSLEHITVETMSQFPTVGEHSSLNPAA